MCELLVELKANAADLIAAARAFENRETSKPGKTQKLNKSNRRNPNA